MCLIIFDLADGRVVLNRIAKLIRVDAPTRQRPQGLAERARDINRVQKVLEGANIKLASVASDVLGVSGRAMLDRLVAGETDPKVLADLAVGRLRAKYEARIPALEGRMGDHQRFLLGHIDELRRRIDALDAEIVRRVDPLEATIQRLCTIPGISRRTAAVIVAELGTDLARFPDADHAAAWAGLAHPKRKCGETQEGGHPGPPAGVNLGGLGRQSYQKHLHGRALSAFGPADAHEEGYHHLGASLAEHCVPRARHRRALPGSGPRLPR